LQYVVLTCLIRTLHVIDVGYRVCETAPSIYILHLLLDIQSPYLPRIRFNFTASTSSLKVFTLSRYISTQLPSYIYPTLSTPVYIYPIHPFEMANSLPVIRTLELGEFDDRIERIGPNSDHYFWTFENRGNFAEWWQLTTWYREEAKKPNPIFPNWGTNRSSIGWKYFVEAAHRIQGIPKVQCKRCKKFMAHPTPIGPSHLAKHIKSTRCKNAAARAGLRQLELGEAPRQKVSYNQKHNQK
jgi:hypothetical protein